MTASARKAFESEAESLRGNDMKQLSPFFVVVGETPTMTICEAPVICNGVARIHRFGILWDEDHDKRIVSVANHLVINGDILHICRIGERKGILTIWSVSLVSWFYENIEVDGDVWGVDHERQTTTDRDLLLGVTTTYVDCAVEV
jgi:hypothetical protein